MTEDQFVARAHSTDAVSSGQITWQSPSNIALVKYWGKTEPQIPTNPSISFTLSNCHTRTTLRYRKKSEEIETFVFKVIFEGQHKPEFHPKIAAFLNRIFRYQPFLKAYEFEIHTENSFPHSSGIASSASGMSALALCLMSLEKRLDPSMTEAFFKQKASFLARLGSGSASRSIEGPLVVWGKHKAIDSSSDLFGVPYAYEVNDAFRDYQDTILLVDKGVKQVSSTVGHGLMNGHPFSVARFQQANDNLEALIPVLKSGDLDGFVQIVEKEALALHAMMMTSSPYFILMRPNTLEIIERVWSYRRETGSKLCFTLDAGANVHLLYPKQESKNVKELIERELAHYCQNNHYISDQTGKGAEEIM